MGDVRRPRFRSAITAVREIVFRDLAAARDVVSDIRRALPSQPSDTPLVVLTQPDIRRFVRKLLELDLHDVRVVSYAELLPEVAIRPTGRTTLVGR